MDIQGDAAKLRTPAPSSAEPQPSSGARRPQRLARHSCSWAAGRVFGTPRQAKGFAHLAPKCTWMLQMLGYIPLCAPMDLPLTDGGKPRPWGQGSIPGGAGLSPDPCSPQRGSGCRLGAPRVDGERGLQAVPGTLKEVQGDKSGSAGRRLAPGAGPDPGRFTCSLIRERGGEGAGLGERQRVGTGRLHGPRRRWREKLSSTSPASGAGATCCRCYGECCPWRRQLSIPGCASTRLSHLLPPSVPPWWVLGGCCCLGAMVNHGRKTMTPVLPTPADHGAHSLTQVRCLPTTSTYLMEKLQHPWQNQCQLKSC